MKNHILIIILALRNVSYSINGEFNTLNKSIKIGKLIIKQKYFL